MPRRKGLGDAPCAGTVRLANRDVCLSRRQLDDLFGGEVGKRIGCGASACAYERPDGKVVKLTMDSDDAKALKRANGSPFTVQVSKVVRLARGQLPSGQLYAVVAERLDPIPKHQERAFEYSHSPGCMSPSLKRLYPDRRAIPECEEIQRWVKDMRADLESRGIVDVEDIHGGNIGLDARGHWKLLDISSAGGVVDVETPLLEGLRRRRRKAKNQPGG